MTEVRLGEESLPRDVDNTLRRKAKSGWRDKPTELVSSVIQDSWDGIQVDGNVVALLQVKEGLQDMAHAFSHG